MQKKLLISLAIGTILSTLALIMAFANVPFSQLFAYLGAINYGWLPPTIAVVAVTFVLRAFRWRLILGQNAPPGFSQAFHPLMIGFMMNCILPGRVGELARPLILKQKHHIPLTTGLATVAAERIFDTLILIMLFVTFFSVDSHLPVPDGVFFGIHLGRQVLDSVATAMVRLSAVLLLVIGLLAMGATRRLIKSAIRATGRWLAEIIPGAKSKTDRIFCFILDIIDNFAAGVSLLRSPRRLIACAGLTLSIWGLTAFSYLVFAKGCPGINLSFTELTTVMVVICFAIALPSAPGFWGLWEAGGLFALCLFGVSGKDALGFILVSHATQIFPVIIMGLISAVLMSVNILNLTGKSAGTKADSHPTIEGA